MPVFRPRGRKSLQRVGSIALLAFTAASGAQAADYLRGAFAPEAEAAKTTSVDWSGIYFGGHAGYSNAQVDASALTDRLAQKAIPNSTITGLLASTINFGRVNKTDLSYGAFAGYNVLWEDVVVGMEVDYTRSSINASTRNGPTALFTESGTIRETVTSSSTARARIREWGTIRARVGWAAGYFMPYLTAGVAIGNIDGRASVDGSTERRDTSTTPPTVDNGSFTGTVGRRGITYGGVIGAGVDMALFSNIFLRAELQHIQFASGGNRPEVSINTARIGGGVKF